MRDNLRRYRAIRDAFIQGYPGQPTGMVARHLPTLAALLSGIVGSQSTQLPKVATHVPEGAKPESRVKRFARGGDNAPIPAERSFVPYAEVMLAHLAFQTLVLVIDGSVVGRGGVALMLHLVYKGRALPLAWVVRRGKKGHFPEALPMALITQVQALMPPGAHVGVLGDGAFDGTDLQHTLQEAGWAYVVRPGSNITVAWDGATFRCETVGAWIKPGTLVELRDGLLTEAAYGPIMLLGCWAKGSKAPLYLVTTIASADEACRLSAKRFRIETFFSAQKSRGFHLHTSQISESTRLARLLMAACFAYIWIVYLGARCEQDGWVCIIHRGDRCDLS
jgi:Transposase DDE domain